MEIIILQHISIEDPGYIKDVNAPRAVMENPIDTSTRGSQLEYNLGFINFN